MPSKLHNRKLHLIYVPGLGDSRIAGQQKAVATWGLWGVTSELCQMNWADNEPWQLKLERLLARIDAAVAHDRPVALVGVSAGASAVINAYALRQDVIVGCVLIAGKANRPEAVGARYRKSDPAFVTSIYDAQASLERLNAAHRRRILSLYALLDEIVPKVDSQITGAVNRRVPTIGHFFTIASQLTLGAPYFIHHVKLLMADKGKE